MAYELLLERNDVSHSRRLAQVFIEIFLPTVKKAALSDPIISRGNKAFESLATDQKFKKSLRLMIPPNQEIEKFLTRTRKNFYISQLNRDQSHRNLYLSQNPLLLNAISMNTFTHHRKKNSI